jgi:MFS family permease
LTESRQLPGRSLLDRLLAAYPLVVAYLVLLILVAWQTTKHSTPWLFTDELEWSGRSQGIAHHGVPELRLHRVSTTSLYPYIIAPSWWLGATSRAYAAIKYTNAALMTAALFPAYALARLFVSRTAAIACGVATAAIPAVVYTGMIIPEPLAYFWSTLALWLIARALRAPSLASIALAVAAIAIAPYVRSELAVIAAAALLATVLAAATSPRGRKLIGSWSFQDRLGAAVLFVGGAVVLGVLLAHHSHTWEIGTHFHHRAFTYGLWAFGAFTIGVGVLPVLITVLWLAGARFRSVDERALAATLVGAVVAFGLYTAVKASYLSTVFAIRVEERNLMYLSPVVFAVTARWLLVGRTRVVATIVGAAAVAYLLETTPYHNNEHFYSDAPGLSILQWLNRTWSVTTTDARHVLFGILIGSVAIVVLREAARRRDHGSQLVELVLCELAQRPRNPAGLDRSQDRPCSHDVHRAGAWRIEFALFGPVLESVDR